MRFVYNGLPDDETIFGVYSFCLNYSCVIINSMRLAYRFGCSIILFRVLVAMHRDGFALFPRPSQNQRPNTHVLKHYVYQQFLAKAY